MDKFDWMVLKMYMYDDSDHDPHLVADPWCVRNLIRKLIGKQNK